MADSESEAELSESEEVEITLNRRLNSQVVAALRFEDHKMDIDWKPVCPICHHIPFSPFRCNTCQSFVCIVCVVRMKPCRCVNRCSEPLIFDRTMSLLLKFAYPAEWGVFHAHFNSREDPTMRLYVIAALMGSTSAAIQQVIDDAKITPAEKAAVIDRLWFLATKIDHQVKLLPEGWISCQGSSVSYDRTVHKALTFPNRYLNENTIFLIPVDEEEIAEPAAKRNKK